MRQSRPPFASWQEGEDKSRGAEVIFVDSNRFVIDLRYPDDPDHRVNRRALDRLAEDGSGLSGLTSVLTRRR